MIPAGVISEGARITHGRAMRKITRLQRAADWVVGIINPRQALRRRHLRLMVRKYGYEQTCLSLLNSRGYRAARQGKNTTPFSGGNGSADHEIMTDLPTLRNRSREVNRDDPIASGITRTFVQKVIGTGIRPQSRTDSPEVNRRLEEIWRERADHLAPAEGVSQGEFQQLLYRRAIEDGDVLLKMSKRSPAEPVWFEVIEADRLATPLKYAAAATEDGCEVRDGVKRNSDGVAVAYYVLNHHPGDTVAALPRDINAFTEIPFWACRHLRRIERPGQTRGVPLFHAILQELRDLDLLMVAALKRTQIASCLAVFIKSGVPVGDIFDVTSEKYGLRLEQDIEPGMMFKLLPEESIETLVPNFPTPELQPFVIMVARRIGAALGICWQMVLKDFSQSTYSSARSDIIESESTFDNDTAWFIATVLRWVWKQVMIDARLRGDHRMRGVTDEQIEQVHWIGNGRKWVDPENDAKAVEIALRTPVTTLQIECAKLGRDWEEVISQRAREHAVLAKLGISDEEASRLLLTPSPSSDKRQHGTNAIGNNGRAVGTAALWNGRRASMWDDEVQPANDVRVEVL